jgi:hypothetical protein
MLHLLASYAMVDHGLSKHRLPGLIEFVPRPPEPEPEQPRDMAGWLRSLRRLAG